MTEEERTREAAIYVRVSTSKQDADNQILQLCPYCDKAGYNVYKIYVDVISGCENSRPGFDRMFKDAHMRLFDVVVFWSLDRFSRAGLKFTIQKIQELENLKIGWDSYTEPYFRTVGPFGEAILGIMATLAKIERDRISDRTKAGLARRKARGQKLGRPKGAKDKKARRTKGYWDNDSVKKGQRKRGGNGNAEIVDYNSISEAEKAANKRPFIECPNPDCGFNLRKFRFGGVEQYKCDKCHFQCTLEEYGTKFKVVKEDE